MAKKTSLVEQMRAAVRAPSGNKSWHAALGDKDPAALAEIHEAIAELGRLIADGHNLSYAQAARLIIRQSGVKVSANCMAEYISRRLNGSK